ncbi:MAG: 3-hydroxyacyl-CoA dehydrogenase NAD-binding domain-containing protein [Gemmatimonadota bacterium]|nr:3-hydroxyacyl-CoA dehydrogenase NAD-binding domain-containing protein [Gemmatimonadota bacterium]MDE2872322.1 3-hydroxyacyl-CoA dehydrogenase NAD-binding domain-containing protein [Gemmatimonadota bacterium]
MPRLDSGIIPNPCLEVDADGVGRLTFDDRDRTHNVLTEEVLRSLDVVVAEAAAATDGGALRALLIRSGKAGSFIAGADVRAISAVAESGDRHRAAEAARSGQALFARIAALPVPTVAAIRGVCLGGGTELALACDYRVCDDDDRTRIGLPEVQLGILPAWGGTTRLPRLVGLRAALGLLLTGKPVRVSKARRIGLVHRVLPRRQFEERSLEFARELAAGGRPNRTARTPRGISGRILDGTAPGRALVLRAARKRVLGRTGGRYPAPLKILEVIRGGLGRSVAANLELEAGAAGELIVSPQCGNLLFLFHLREGARKGPWAAGGRAVPVRRMAVIGAGHMGGGIAQVAAYNGIPVRIKDVRHEAVAGGLAHARSIFDGAVKRRRLKPRDARDRMGLISGGLDYAGVGQADLVVEAVVERMDVKKTVLAEVEAVVGSAAVIATNTSSLSVDEMASALARPGRFAGMHFFGPVHRMPLVEIVRGEKTDSDTVETIAALVVRMGKVPVVTRDGPGFLVNRVLGLALNEAGHLLDEGNDGKALDGIWTDFGMPMGPCRLIDEVGMDIARHAGDTLAEAFGERMEPAASLVALGESGRLGRKGGRGFYLYAAGQTKGFDPTVYADMGQPSRRSTPDPARVRDRMVLAMVNEAARILEDGIVNSAADVDLGMVMGTGFPPFRGGLLRYADDRGPKEVLKAIEAFRDSLGPRFRPAPLLTELAKAGETFHGAFPAARGDPGRTAT